MTKSSLKTLHDSFSLRFGININKSTTVLSSIRSKFFSHAAEEEQLPSDRRYQPLVFDDDDSEKASSYYEPLSYDSSSDTGIYIDIDAHRQVSMQYYYSNNNNGT